MQGRHKKLLHFAIKSKGQILNYGNWGDVIIKVICKLYLFSRFQRTFLQQVMKSIYYWC